MTTIETVSQQTRRRYILGRQGLWPGRRWVGKAGLEECLREIEAVQIDPVSIVTPSADIVLWGRVAEYEPAHLQTLLYEERKFFDYGGGLGIYPMSELPHWRVVMARKRSEKRWAAFFAENSAVVASVREELRSRGPLRNRDIQGESVSHYRGSKITGVALYYLWLSGELMTSQRDGKERVYDFLENVAPPKLQQTSTPAEAEEFFAHKAIARLGFVTARSFRNVWKGLIERPVDAKEANAKLAQMLESNQVTSVNIEGEKEQRYFLADDLPILEMLHACRIPRQWAPSSNAKVDSAKLDGVIFLSPLEYVSARGRAGKLFDFEYVWEIYKPAEKRKYGPYTLPILYGDRLVGRTDVKLERQQRELRINDLWFEEWFSLDENFVAALAKGLETFMQFLGAASLDLDAVKPNTLRQELRRRLSS